MEELGIKFSVVDENRVRCNEDKKYEPSLTLNINTK